MSGTGRLARLARPRTGPVQGPFRPPRAAGWLFVSRLHCQPGALRVPPLSPGGPPAAGWLFVSRPPIAKPGALPIPRLSPGSPLAAGRFHLSPIASRAPARYRGAAPGVGRRSCLPYFPCHSSIWVRSESGTPIRYAARAIAWAATGAVTSRKTIVRPGDCGFGRGSEVQGCAAEHQAYAQRTRLGGGVHANEHVPAGAGYRVRRRTGRSLPARRPRGNHQIPPRDVTCHRVLPPFHRSFRRERVARWSARRTRRRRLSPERPPAPARRRCRENRARCA